MSNHQDVRHPEVEFAAEPADQHSLVRRAWWAVAAFPLSFAAATLLGSGLIALQGYDQDAPNSLPIRVALLAGVPALCVLLAPAWVAVRLGRAATRLGSASGRYLVVVGLVVAVVMAAVNIAGLLAQTRAGR